MFRLDAVLISGHLFRHKAHTAAIILVNIINVIFSCFYSCFDGLGNIWDFIVILVIA